MAIIGIDFMWYDAFFMAMLVISAIFVTTNWQKYHICAYPLHIWTAVNYAAVFVFRLLMFVDNAFSAGMGLDRSWQQRHARFYARLTVLAVLGLVLYPFLFAWSIIGTFWFIHSKSCFPDNGQKLAFVIWLLFSYCALLGILCVCIAKWLTRRQAHQLQAQQGSSISEIGVLIDLIRVPDWAFEAADQVMGRMGQDAAFHPERHLTQAVREAVEASIQELPKFELRPVPTNSSECSICLEEFHVGNEVRGLPCAHNFHTECIDRWLRLNIKCPICRCSVFPNLDTSAIIQAATRNYILRSRSLITPNHSETEQVRSGSEGLVNVEREHEDVEIIQVAVDGSSQPPS